MADDLGPDDLGCYGWTQIVTPNIDWRAALGMGFTETYAGGPLCAPSRCSLLTGRHHGCNRIRDNVPHGVFLRDEDVTIGKLLRSAGYRNGGDW